MFANNGYWANSWKFEDRAGIKPFWTSMENASFVGAVSRFIVPKCQLNGAVVPGMVPQPICNGNIANYRHDRNLSAINWLPSLMCHASS